MSAYGANTYYSPVEVTKQVSAIAIAGLWRAQLLTVGTTEPCVLAKRKCADCLTSAMSETPTSP